MVGFSWDLEILLFVVAVVWSAVGFSIYIFLSRNKSLVRKIWKAKPNLDSQAKEIVLQRLWGFNFLGVFPVIFILFFPDKSLKDFGLDPKTVSRTKNMFALGMVYWMFDHDLKYTQNFIEKKLEAVVSLLTKLESLHVQL